MNERGKLRWHRSGTQKIRVVRRAAEELGIPDSLEFVGFLQQREEVIEHRQTCDVGLAVVPRKALDPNLVDLFGASDKIFGLHGMRAGAVGFFLARGIAEVRPYLRP